MQQPYQSYQAPMYTMQPAPKKRGQFRTLCGCCLGISLLVFCILGIPLACFGIFIAGNPDPLYADYQADATVAANYDFKFDDAINDARNDNSFEVSIEQREFESWLNVEYRDNLAENNDGEDLPAWVEDMKFQTKFDDSEITLFGTTDFSGVSVNMVIVSEVSINQDSITAPTQPLKVEVTKFQLGGVNMPESFRTSLADSIADALGEELTQVNQRYELTSLTVENGYMRFSGRVVR